MIIDKELLSMQLALLSLKNKYETKEPGIKFSENAKMSDIIDRLPFKLTKAQLRVLSEIDKDMESTKPMNRLLQGDVCETVIPMSRHANGMSRPTLPDGMTPPYKSLFTNGKTMPTP